MSQVSSRDWRAYLERSLPFLAMKEDPSEIRATALMEHGHLRSRSSVEDIDVNEMWYRPQRAGHFHVSSIESPLVEDQYGANPSVLLLLSRLEVLSLRRQIASLKRMGLQIRGPVGISEPEGGTHLEVSLQGAFERMEKIAALEPNWDSYGADPPSARAISRAYSLVAAIVERFGDAVGDKALPWSVAPLADGGVQLEWRGLGGAVEIEIGPDGDYGYLMEKGEEPNVEYREGDDISTFEVYDLVESVLGF